MKVPRLSPAESVVLRARIHELLDHEHGIKSMDLVEALEFDESRIAAVRNNLRQLCDAGLVRRHPVNSKHWLRTTPNEASLHRRMRAIVEQLSDGFRRAGEPTRRGK
jgi:Fe2+ or Zn2+ uptake regulation protein